MDSYIGKTFWTKSGRKTTIVDESLEYVYHATVQGDDGIWRYVRESDWGRCTASNFDMSDPRNLLPEEVSPCMGWRIVNMASRIKRYIIRKYYNYMLYR